MVNIMPKVSICIPAYKDLCGIKRLINSIRNQSFTDYEIILTDDTPDDSILKYIDEVNNENTLSIKYYHNEPSLGTARNWNYSISLAQGEYIKIMHQDDFFTFDDSLYKFVKMLDDSPAAILAFSGSRQVRINKDNPCDLSDFYDRHILESNLELISKDWKNLFLGGFIGAPSAVIFRNCDKRFDLELSWLIDSDFYMNLLKDNQNKFIYDFSPLVSICMSEEQLTNSCINSKDINIFEHKHLYTKYNLDTVEAYQEKLINTVIEYKGNFSDISMLDVDYALYKKHLSEYRKKKLLFLINVVLRKLHIKK